MSFLRAARAALTGYAALLPVLAVLVGLSLSCGNGTSTTPSAPNHGAYVTLPSKGVVQFLQIEGSTGALIPGPITPPTENISPTGLALMPSKKFLFAVNPRANTISIFNVASDGSLTLSGAPVQAGSGPSSCVIDPTGQFLLVTNSLSNNISVFSINASSGALTEIAGSPFWANTNPTNIVITHAGKFVFVTNPGIGMVTGYSLSSGVLTPIPGSPFFSGAGAAALTVDGSDRFLYVANPYAVNPLLTTVGNISGFNVDPNTGALTPILGTPFAATDGSGPTAITVDPTGRFVYATTPGSSFSIWCFSINPPNGQLTAVTGSPFSLTSGGLFALFDPSGNYFYIGSASGTAIAGYTYNPSTGSLTAVANSPFSVSVQPGGMVLTE